MARMELFRYAVLRQPSEEEAKKGRKSELVVPPTEFKLYSSEAAVRMEAARAIPAEKFADDDADRYEVAVASF